MSDPEPNLKELVEALSRHPSVVEKAHIHTAYSPAAEVSGSVLLGDDCAAIADEATGGHLLFAAEGIISRFVEDDPWFAGYSAVMVNLSDVAAMGGTSIAITDILWCSESDHEKVDLIWDGMRAASSAYGVPIVGGHTTRHSQPGDRVTLAAAVLGRAGPRLLTSFDAEVDDCLVIVVDTAGAYRKDKPFWNASTTSEPEKLRRLMGLLPKLAERGLCRAAKDISNGGIVGTLAMFTESSKVGALLDLDTLYRPRDTAWLKWLTSFPSFGYLLAIPAKHLTEVRALFALEPSVFVESVGRFIEERSLIIAQGGELENLQFPQMP